MDSGVLRCRYRDRDVNHEAEMTTNPVEKVDRVFLEITRSPAYSLSITGNRDHVHPIGARF